MKLRPGGMVRTGWFLWLLAILLNSGMVRAQELDDLLSMDMRALMNLTVKSASGLEESLRDAPAALVVITAEEIQARGYVSLDELFDDLPGFDVVRAQGTPRVNAYQRGYRTPLMQRTLFMVDGVVDNHLWSHVAILSRQYPLSAIERVEVLYGPTSAVYGPNAFLGIIHVITHSGAQLENGKTEGSLTATVGDYQTRSLEGTVRGKRGDWHFNLSARGFRDSGPDFDDYAEWGYFNEDWLDNREVWGPVLDRENAGVRYGELHNPARDWGILGRVGYRDFTLGWIGWQTKEGYGAFYTADRVQPNAFLNHGGQQLYLTHEGEVEQVKVASFVGYHHNRLWGGWVEGGPDGSEGQAMQSYLSISDWNSQNHSWLFKQDYDWAINDTWRLTGGIKYEAKTLTMAYDVCSYWSGTFCSSAIPGDEGPYGLGSGIFHSTDPEVLIKPGTAHDMAEDNLEHTRDQGLYAQVIRDRGAWRALAGLRFDHNSLYGNTLNPRASLIYRYSPNTVFKWLYGRAFQEPSPIHLWGGWNGRQGNPDLKPEKAENLEFIIMRQVGRWLHDISFFHAHYRDVVKEEAENAGSRTIWGLEYRGRFSLPNPLANQKDLKGFLYYTHTRATSSIHYDHDTGAWVDGSAELGDIARHKVSAGVDWPLHPRWNLNLRANYVDARALYLRNPLREQGREAPSYTVLHANLRYRQGPFGIKLGIRNLLDREYYLPGIEHADSGDDFSQRSAGFRNSLIPQPGRSWWLTVDWRF